MGVTEFKEIGHCDNLAQLVVQELIERYEQPAKEQYHPALHLPVGHTYTILSTCSCKTNVGSKDCHTYYVPWFALAEEIIG